MDPGCLIRTITTICVPLVFGLIVFVGIFGNALVIIVVTTNAQAGTIHKKRNGMLGWVGPKVCANPIMVTRIFFPLANGVYCIAISNKIPLLNENTLGTSLPK